MGWMHGHWIVDPDGDRIADEEFDQLAREGEAGAACHAPQQSARPAAAPSGRAAGTGSTSPSLLPADGPDYQAMHVTLTAWLDDVRIQGPVRRALLTCRSEVRWERNLSRYTEGPRK